MLEFNGDLWTHHPKHWVGVTTNGTISNTRECVMGKGCALEAKRRYPFLSRALGERILYAGNLPYIFPEWKIITIPVKHNWYEKADPNLIEISLNEINFYVEEPIYDWCSINRDELIYIPRPGCGNGKLDWESHVKNLPAVKNLSDKFVVCHK